MEVKNQKVKRGTVTKMPLLFVLGLCAVILAAGFFSIPSSADHDSLSDKDKDRLLFADARAQIARLQAQSAKPAPQAAPSTAVVALPPEPKLSEEAAFERYQQLHGMKDEPAQPTIAQRWEQQRQQAFLQALSSSSTVALNFARVNDNNVLSGKGADRDAGAGVLTAKQRQLRADSERKLNALQGKAQDGELAAYAALDGGDMHALSYQVESVDTPFIIRQGAVVPAVLLTGINSDIPGQVMAQTTAPVYDSPRGNYELIPAGCRLVGQYLSQPAYGTERVMLAFNRIIFPDGKALTLGAMPASALDGYAGLNAEVNNHMLRLLSGALLLGGITAMVAVTQDDAYDSDGNLTTSSAMSQAIGMSLGQVLADVIERNLNIAPTLEVKPGFKFNLTLVKDLRFKGPYQAFDYNT